MDFSVSKKNKKITIIDGFMFRFHKLLKYDVQRWSCCFKLFKSYFKYENNFNIIHQTKYIFFYMTNQYASNIYS